MPQAFDLPKEREAGSPAELRGLARDGVSMLVSDARAGTHEVGRFLDIAKYMRAGDLLVVNDSATIPAALSARRANGSEIQLHLSTRLSKVLWIVEPRNAPLLRAGERFALPAGGLAELLAPVHAGSARLWYANFTPAGDTSAYLHSYARPISYAYVEETFPIDYYQTIFAREPGSVEMPSAGRPFTLRVLDSLYRSNVNVASITLHCGVSSPESHEPPLDERVRVPAWTAAAINAARKSSGRIIAAGTTVVRALETAADACGEVHALQGWTSRIVDPAHPPRVVDGLLTGFHEPRASHLNMLEAFVVPQFLEAAYDRALAAGLLWHEFGDVHLLLR